MLLKQKKGKLMMGEESLGWAGCWVEDMVTMGAMALVVVRLEDVTQDSASYALSMGGVGIIVDLCAGGSAVRWDELN